MPERNRTPRNTTLRNRHRATIRAQRPNCHICGQPINWDAHRDEPDSFAIDHVIPLSKGGEDALHNIKAAHRHTSVQQQKASPQVRPNRPQKRRSRIRTPATVAAVRGIDQLIGGVDMSDRTCNRCKAPLTSRQKKYCSHTCANRTAMRAKSERLAQRPQKACDVDGCLKPSRSMTAEYCPMHYHRLYRYGSLLSVAEQVANGDRIWPTAADLIGKRFGTITVMRRVGGMWDCECDCGQRRTARTGDLNRTGDQNTCGVPGQHLAEYCTYSAAHERARRKYGRPETHKCVGCGNPAQHWSYDHSDPDEVYDTEISASPVAYSLNPDHYSPRCVPCHKRYDLGRKCATPSRWAA